MLATYAAEELGDTSVIIVSKKRRSMLHGCQFLHEPIDGLETESATVNYSILGTVEEYARKVYGTDRPPVVSPQLYTGERPVWDLRSVYRQLYDRYEELIIDSVISPFTLEDMLREMNPDVVISTIPRPMICRSGTDHQFTSQRCWAIGDAPEEGQEVDNPLIAIPIKPFTVVCDGRPEVSWYRSSNIFGYRTIEWSAARRKPPIEGVVSFDKPISTTCYCWRSIHCLGRYGTWTKGVLAHHAYADAMNYLTAFQNNDINLDPEWRH